MRIQNASIVVAATMAVCAGSIALGQSGDVNRGKTVFETAGCLSCHRIDDKGSRTGPDLSDIGGRRTAEKIQVAVLTPDAEVLPENRYVRVVQKDGVSIQGRILNQDAFSIQLIDTKEQLRSVQRARVKESEILDKGIMPSFQARLKAQEMADLVAYLGSLKGTE